MSAPGEFAISQVWNRGFLERYQKGRLNLFESLVQRGGEIAFLRSLIFNYRSEESIPTRVPDEALEPGW